MTQLFCFSPRGRGIREKNFEHSVCGVWVGVREKEKDFSILATSWELLSVSGGIALITAPACQVGADSSEPKAGRRSLLPRLCSRVSIWPSCGHRSLCRLPRSHSLLLRRRFLLRLPPRRDCGLRGDAVGPLQRHAARVVLAKVLVEDGLEREAFATDVAVEGLVASVLADVVLQLILACVLLPTHAADKGCDAHVETHVPVQAAFLIEGFGAVNTSEPRVVPEPALRNLLLPEILHIAAHSKHG